MKTFFDVTSKKSGLHVFFLQKLGAVFGSQTTLGATFTWTFKDFAQIFRDSTEFLGIVSRFQ